ncbi:hypothetical protein [Geodermatophilus nigrescens]|uniref:Uncharacterized protein n=1 Tax=Geodermatophilus nigrescens TaxID=1070870 RepID=A0A1M5DSR5_9ACTN|nr:hypothetical protein [Geodermatophilus nigrescens]SHF69965.1 hypothetical protein SAMN05444351_0516 [Geodermatophilus nigrescens]
MAARDLQDLVRRRLWELGETVYETSRRARGAVGPEVLERLAHSRGWALISPWMATQLARALDVPENRVRRAAGLPEVADPRTDVPTGPHLRLLHGGASRAGTGEASEA